jgi:hypothetical protein
MIAVAQAWRPLEIRLWRRMKRRTPSGGVLCSCWLGGDLLVEMVPDRESADLVEDRDGDWSVERGGRKE